MYLVESYVLHRRDFGSWVLILGNELTSSYKPLKVIYKILHILIFMLIFLERWSIAFLIFSKDSNTLKKVRNWSGACLCNYTIYCNYRWEKLTCWRWQSYQVVGHLTAKPGIFCVALSSLSCIIFVDNCWASVKYIIFSNSKSIILRLFSKVLSKIVDQRLTNNRHIPELEKIALLTSKAFFVFIMCIVYES